MNSRRVTATYDTLSFIEASNDRPPYVDRRASNEYSGFLVSFATAIRSQPPDPSVQVDNRDISRGRARRGDVLRKDA